MSKIFRNNGTVIIEDETKSFKELVEYCAKNDISLKNAYLYEANLRYADLRYADLRYANLGGADLRYADLSEANLSEANLSGADLGGADLSHADLRDTYLRGADLKGANLKNVKGLSKKYNFKQGEIYWKRFGKGLKNNDYQFYVGLNELRPGEIFASDERKNCSYPGFHFASRKWCDKNYFERPLEAKIRIPLDAQINEPWTSDGKASADKIEILQVFDAKTGEDVTELYRKIN